MKNNILMNILLVFLFLMVSGTAYAATPVITNSTPADDSFAISINSSVTATVNDSDGNLMNITFSMWNGTSWKTMQTFTNRPNGKYTASGVGYFTKPYTEYMWKVNVTDSTGESTQLISNFTTGNLLKLKWSKNLTGYDQQLPIMPVIGDIDGDGEQEIVFSYSISPSVFYLVSLNAKTGAIEWQLDMGSNSVELVDLDNDGIPEVLASTVGPRAVAINGNGSIRWTSQKISGDGVPLYPIVAYDIDGNGYPEIYFATQDYHPDPYSGNISYYNGVLAMLDHNGNVLKETNLIKPCWGGLAIADSDYDGRFEVYTSDRRDGYDGIPALGLQAYHADTLEPIWSRPDLQHSSPIPIIADVYDGGDLEIVAQPITLRGPIVLNATDGKTFILDDGEVADYQTRGLPTHASATVYDIDKDGNLEIIMGTSYPSDAPADFAVFDLITGQTDFRPTFNYHTNWPPTVGSVTPDGEMQILAAMGDMGSIINYPLLIYDSKYRLIDRMDVRAGQLSPAKVTDIDGDGLNEVVLAGAAGKIVVYDTLSPTPNPAPRAGVQFYSEMRRGAAEYVEPPGPKAPIIKNEFPLDNSKNIPVDTVLTVFVHDYQKDLSSIDFEIYHDNDWVLLQSFSTTTSGNYNVDPSGYIDYSDQIMWRVTTRDSKDNSNQKVFNFFTINGTTNKPIIMDETPQNLATDVSLDTAELQFSLTDSDNDLMSYEVTTIPNIGLSSGSNITNGVYSLPINGLEDNTVYKWNIAVTDGTEWSYRTFTFKTLKSKLDLLTDTKFDSSDDSIELADNGIGQDWYESRGQNQSLVTLNIDNIGGNTGKKARLSGGINSSTDNVYLSQEFVEPQYTNFSVSWDIYVDEILNRSGMLNNTRPDRAGVMIIGDDIDSTRGPGSINADRFVYMVFDKKGGATEGVANLVAIDRYNSVINVSTDISLDMWHNIHVDVDVKNGFYDVYVDKEFKKRVLSRYPKQYVSHITFAQWSDAAGTFYVDNVKEFTNESDDQCFDFDLDGFNGTDEFCGLFDCVDDNSSINPSALELCNGVDDNCDGIVDEGCTVGLDGWMYRKMIIINHTKIVNDLSAFPVLIDLNDADLSSGAQPNGDDIVFTTSDGVTKLSHEIESYNSGTLTAWVKTNLSSSADTILYMYYGNPTATNQEDAENVWDSDYLAVHHLEEKIGMAIDSTSNNNDGTADNGIVQDSTGFIDNGYTLDGVNDKVSMPRVFTSQSAFTIEGWVNTGSKQGYVVSQRGTTGVFLQYYPGENNFQMYVNSLTLKIPSSANSWHYVVGTYDGATARLYVDAGTPTSGTATLTWPDLQTLVGDRSTGGRAYLGSVDEVRLSDVARSDAYIQTSFNNQNNPETFYASSSEEQLTACSDGDTQQCGTTDVGECSYGISTCSAGVWGSCVGNVEPVTEICDGLDNNCDGAIDESLTTTYYWDSDSDLFGNPSSFVDLCSMPAGYVTDNTDCNDADASINPSAAEVCDNGVDDNCDGNIDEGCGGYPAWTHRKTITVAKENVASDITGFPLLVSIDDSDLTANAQPDGDDIFFTAADGMTKLSHEVESYDSGKLVAWVKTDLSSSADTVIYMYYGNTAATNQEDTVNVWDNDYLTVQHLEDSGVTAVDSNGINDGTLLNGVSIGVVAKVGNGFSFDGTDDRVTMSQLFSGQNEFTFEAWVNTENKQGYVVSQRDSSSNGAFIQYYPGEGNFQMYVNSLSIKVPATTSTWHYVVGTYDGTTARLYVDAGTPASGDTNLIWPSLDTYVGDRTALNRAFQGSIDELRVSEVARSDAYISASYENQNDPGTFYSLGAQE